MTTRASKQPHTPGPYCDRFAALLPLLNTNELEPEEAIAARAHLSDCRWCQRQLRDYGTVERVLRQHLTALEASFPALSAQEIVTLAEHTSPTQSAPAPAPIQPTRHPRPMRRFLAWAGPIAAVLLIVLLTVSVFSVRGHPAASNQGTPALYASTLHDIVALRQSDGKLLWRSSVTSDTFGTPISDHGIVYSVAFRVDRFSLVALSANEGKELWEHLLPPNSQPAIAAANGMVYVATTVYHCCQSEILDRPALLAYRGSDGKELWRYDAPTTDISTKTKSNIQPQFSSAPIVYGNILYIGLEDMVMAFQAGTGHHLWTASLNLAPAAVAPDGTPIYTPEPGNEWLAADSTSVYVYTDIPHQETPESTYVNGSFAQVFALRASDGALILQADLGTNIQDSFLPPIFVNNRLYLVVAQVDPQADNTTLVIKVMILLIRDDQQPSTPVASGSGSFPEIRALAPPMYADGTLYYYSSNHSFDALRLSDHQLLWDHPLGFAATFLGTSDTAVFLLTYTSIQALSVSDGHLLWVQVLADLK